jgi:RND family efflux transporter MFP subunit
MSATRQIVLSLIVVLIAAAGWYAYGHGWFAAQQGGRDTVAGAGQGGGAGAGGPRGQGLAGGRGGPVLVVTAPVGIDDTGIDVRAVGTVAAAQEVTLYPQDSGIVVELDFAPGAEVTKGQTLVRLDDSDQQVALQKAKIALDAAQSALDRAQQLAKSNNITTVALTDALTAQKNAAIGLKAAENDLAKRTIKAPFAGIIGLTDIAVGDLISSSKAIATLDDMSNVTVAFDVPERASGLVAVGQPVAASTAALAGQTFKGTVSAVDNRVDSVARTLRVEATLPNDANALKPGMALTVAMNFAGQPHPSVPSLAVQWDRDGAYVWKIADGSAHRVAVQILGRRSGSAIVSGELVESDLVVVEGLQRLREGSKVTEGASSAAAGVRGGKGAGSGNGESVAPEAAAGGAGVGGGNGGDASGAGRGNGPRRPPSG